MKYLKLKTETTIEDHGISKIVFLMICMIMFSIYLPFFASRLFGLTSLLIAVILLIFVSSIDLNSVYKMLPSACLCLICLVLLLVSGRWKERGFSAPIFHAYKFIYLFLAHTMYIVLRFLTHGQKRTSIMAATGAAILTSAYSSFYSLTIDRYAMRYGNYVGVADFNQVYGIVFFVIILFSALLFYQKNARVNVYLFGCFVIFFGMICISLFTTALLLMLLGIIICLFANIYEKSSPFIRVILFLLMLLLIGMLFMFSNTISDWIFKSTEDVDDVLRVRLRSVSDRIFDTEHNLEGYNADRRGELADYSMQSFKANPIFGVGYTGFGYGIIGNHQEWQDMLGVFGLFGSAVVIGVILIMTNQIFKGIRKKVDKISFTVSLLLFVLLGFLNPCFNPQVLIAVFVIAPNISALSQSEEKTDEFYKHKYIRATA